MVMPRSHRYTYAQYVALERESSTKHEFFDGEIYAMARGSEEHSALAAKVLVALDGAVGDRPCRVHTKLAAYKTIRSLREYIVVSHRERRITVHRRGDGDTWTMRVGITNGRVAVESLGLELVVDSIYRNSAI